MIKKILQILVICLIGTYVEASVYCPICEKSFSIFKTAGTTIKRKNAQCPACKSLERHRYLWLYLKNNKLKDLKKKNLTILHWAPERCISNKILQYKNINYIGADLDPSRYGSYTRKLDITRIDLPDNSVDVIICSHVLEHIITDDKAMREMRRILKPNGYALIVIPLYRNLKATYEDFSITSRAARIKHFDQEDHVRKYGNDFPNRLKAAGFKVKQQLVSKMSKKDLKRYGIADYPNNPRMNAAGGSDIFICTK